MPKSQNSSVLGSGYSADILENRQGLFQIFCGYSADILENRQGLSQIFCGYSADILENRQGLFRIFCRYFADILRNCQTESTSTQIFCGYFADILRILLKRIFCGYFGADILRIFSDILRIFFADILVADICGYYFLYRKHYLVSRETQHSATSQRPSEVQPEFPRKKELSSHFPLRVGAFERRCFNSQSFRFWVDNLLYESVILCYGSGILCFLLICLWRIQTVQSSRVLVSKGVITSQFRVEKNKQQSVQEEFSTFRNNNG